MAYASSLIWKTHRKRSTGGTPRQNSRSLWSSSASAVVVLRVIIVLRDILEF